MAIFNSYVSLPEGTWIRTWWLGGSRSGVHLKDHLGTSSVRCLIFQPCRRKGRSHLGSTCKVLLGCGNFDVVKDGQCIHMRRCFHSVLLSSDMFWGYLQSWRGAILGDHASNIWDTTPHKSSRKNALNSKSALHTSDNVLTSQNNFNMPMQFSARGQFNWGKSAGHWDGNSTFDKPRGKLRDSGGRLEEPNCLQSFVGRNLVIRTCRAVRKACSHNMWSGLTKQVGLNPTAYQRLHCLSWACLRRCVRNAM